MEIAFVTDEISANPEEAIQIGCSWGIKLYELRVIGENRVPHISEAEKQNLKALAQKHNIKYTAISPGTFKGNLQNDEQIQHELNEVLPKTFELAKYLGIDTVITFGFERSEQDDAQTEQKAISIFRQLAEKAEAQNLIIAVENEPGFFCDSGENMARIITAVDSDAFRVNWDPANAIGSAEIPYPDGYHTIKKWITNVHIKDTIKGALIKCVPLGEGVVDWPGQIKSLKEDKLVPFVTIETHCLPLVEKSKHNLDLVRKLLDS